MKASDEHIIETHLDQLTKFDDLLLSEPAKEALWHKLQFIQSNKKRPKTGTGHFRVVFLVLVMNALAVSYAFWGPNERKDRSSDFRMISRQILSVNIGSVNQ